MAMSWQASLLDLDVEPAIDPSLTGLRRIDLDDSTWVELLVGWARGGDALLEQLATDAPWGPQRQRRMYDAVVDEPRILAHWPDLTALPPVIADMQRALSRRYVTDFDRVAVNLYRDGRDSVAWHGDRVRLTHTDPLVATVSLGARRRFLLRPRGGGRTVLSLQLGAGDLLVMGGACQHAYEHTVPKVAHAGARMSLTFRHSGQQGQLDPVRVAAVWRPPMRAVGGATTTLAVHTGKDLPQACLHPAAYSGTGSR